MSRKIPRKPQKVLKQMILGELILFLLCSSAYVTISTEINQNALFTPQTASERNIWDKIDTQLYEIILNPSRSGEIINLIIMFHTYIDVYNLPSSVQILAYFKYINGIEANSPAGEIIRIAQLTTVKSIWINRQIDSAETTAIDVQSFIRSAGANYDPTFANFTKEIGATELHSKGFNGSDVIIAVLDTGVDITGASGGDLDDFDGNTSTADVKYLGGVSMMPHEPLYYSDLNGRGTFHTGIACGTGDLNASYIGVAPGASYLNVKVYDSIGITFWSFIISGIDWAINHGADIILFATTIPGLYLDPVCNAVNYAVDKGLLVIAPVGDDGPGYMSINSPGQASKALTVGAYNSFTGDVWNQSSRGPSFDFAVGPDVIAPGVGLIGPRARMISESSLDMFQSFSSLAAQYGLSFNFNLDFDLSAMTGVIPKSTYGEPLSEDSNYTRASGTGAAAAVVAGAAAILMSAFPMASPQFIHQALVKTATPVTKIEGRLANDMNAEGGGLINVTAAFNWLTQVFPINEYKIIPMAVPLIYPGIITSSDFRNISSTELAQFSGNQLDSYDITSLFSTQAMMTGLIIMNSTDTSAMNMTSIHLPLNQFGLSFTRTDIPNKSQFYWFSQFNVVREMHQMVNNQYYQEGYNRYAGVLELDGLYVVVLAESWSYCGEYTNTTVNISIPNPFYNFTQPTDIRVLNITDRVNAFKFTFNFINDKPNTTYQNMNLLSYFKADLFMNETGMDLENMNYSEALDFSYDDRIYFDPTSQMIWVEDENNNTDYYSDKWATMGFKSDSHPISRYAISDSIGLLANLTIRNVNASEWNTTTNQYLNNTPGPNIDPGFATMYRLEDIPYGGRTEFTSVLSVGLGNSSEFAQYKMFNNTELILNNVTQYNITDLMVITADFNRMAEKNIPYYSSTKIINLGNNDVASAQLAFAVNRSNTNDVLEIYSIIHIVSNLKPYEIRSYNATWVPLEAGVYAVGWVFGTADYMALQQEANILSNSLAITVFVIDGKYYDQIKKTNFLVFPTRLDQNPMRIFTPLDIGIYNLTVISIRNINNVVVGTDGLGRNLVILNQTKYEILKPYDSILVLMIGNPICPPGVVKFNLTFTIDGESTPFYIIPVEIQILPSRGRILFDITHLNFFVSENIFGTLGLSIFNGMSDLDIDSMDENSLGSFVNMDDFEIDANANFDITRLFDLNERMDTPWGNFYNLRQLWSNPNTNHGKGATLVTLPPLIELNITEYIKEMGIDMGDMNIKDIRTSEILPPTSFLGQTLGDYYFESDVISTNWINRDILQFFDALVINDPEQALLDKEITNITSWVAEGGTLYVFAEDKYSNHHPSLNKLINKFGFELEPLSFHSFATNGYYEYTITPIDENDDLFYQTSIKQLMFKDPIKITKLTNASSNAQLLCNGTIARTSYGKGKVIIVGDNDIFKNLLLDKADNREFNEQILRVGLSNYYQTNITTEPQVFPLYKQGYVDFNITNYADMQEKGLIDKGFLFLSLFFFENGTMFNASIYGMSVPGLPMFHTDDSHYSTYLDSAWYLVPGDYYILIIIDHPAAVSEMYYIKFRVTDGPKPIETLRYQYPTEEYPHYIDIIGVLSCVLMGISLFYYNMEKYKKRLRITPLQGNYLNIAQTRLNEGKTLVKLLLRGLEQGDVEEIERVRFLLTNRKRIMRYFKDLKDFGENIGEHF